ncbi:hypothetical protein V8E51_012881 [Hyaloscypha variabilis]
MTSRSEGPFITYSEQSRGRKSTDERDRSPSPESKTCLRAHRKQLPAAIVLTWSSKIVYVRCPFESCQEVHHHGYVEPKEWFPNSRLSDCEENRHLYRILFPFEDDPLVDGFGVKVDRPQGIWRTVSRTLEDPRLEGERLNSLALQMATTHISSPTWQIGTSYVDKITDEEGDWFISECVTNDIAGCQQRLEKSDDPERLVRGHIRSNGKTCLAMACEEGHLEIVELLYKKGADVESVDRDGNTPLMLAVMHHHGDAASSLILNGGSTTAQNNEGISVLHMAQSTLKGLREQEWMTSRSENETLFRYEDRKANKQHFAKLIDLSKAMTKSLKAARITSRKVKTIDQEISNVKTRRGLETRISVLMSKYTVPMANEKKTFACISLGEPFDDVCAVSGYTRGELGGIDGCLDREEWTSKVFMFSHVLGHHLNIHPDMDKNSRPFRAGSFNASHAEKQVMAYVLWNLTSTRTDDDFGNEQMEELEKSRPRLLRTEFDVFVTKEPCVDCRKFQQQVHEVARISFNIKILSPE